jgi:membrane-bound lytic murein transglycosylase D
MTKRPDPPLTALARAVCCSALLVAGCASVAPPSGQGPSASAGDLSSTQARTSDAGARAKWLPAPDGVLVKVELAEQPHPQAIDLTDAPDDLFQRIRHGFAMPELNDDLVLYHQQWYLNRPDYLRRMVDRSSRYLHYIVEELDKRGMPMELALLPMVESAYNPMAYSRSKASGLWQFIPATGKRYNLDQDWWKDDRRDIVASTSAALDYLQSIYEMHGDWHLALASYNWGEGAVGRAIGKNRAQGLPTDYQSLTMPSETRNYVPKLQALKNIFRNPALMAELALPRVPNRPFFATVTTDSHIDVKVAAKLAEMPVQEFVALNPAHNRAVIKPDTPLVIPAEKLETFVSNLEAHSDENKPLSAWQTYTLRPGDRLEKIAPRFGMTVAKLKAVNGIQGKIPLSPGLTLLVSGSKGPGEMAALPEQPHQPDAEPRPEAKPRVHTVRKGETLAAVARRYDLSAAELKKINNLKGDRVTAGMRLQLAAAAPEAKAGADERRKPAADKAAVPVRTAAAQKPAEKTAPAKITKVAAKAAPKTTRYTVRRGDTIYSIARQFKVAADDLMRRNRVSPDSLRPGTTLTIELAENS